ncbi:MAG: BNR-4 repeat-containing protein [Clostridia bacterium]|nr:BNR-4 repeat-containing protein [Clostridia bacterium]
MINISKSKEIRIKRGNTDWWINEKSMVGINGKTYITYVTDMGEIHVKELDAKCSKSISRDVCLCRINCDFSDEHNAPSICVMDSGKIIIAYTGHNVKGVRYKVTKNPFDIMSFGPEQILEYDGTVTYAQLSENTYKNELWLFTRVNSVTWEFRYSSDEGITWSKPHTFLKSDAGGLFYLDVRKQYRVHNHRTPQEQWFFALYGHPKVSADHTIRSAYFNNDGQLLLPDDTPLSVNLYDENTLMDLDTLSVVYESPQGTTVRLLSVCPTMPYRVGLASFELDKPETIVYYSSTFKDGKWVLSQPIAKAGAFLSDVQTDGSQTYVPGMSYYYGVGEAGIHEMHGGISETNRIFLARKGENSWLLESYLSKDCGSTYTREQIIKEIPLSENKKIWRPIVPIYAQDNLPVYWHEGTYTAHTGGWHCDTVMYVEYDD